MQKAGAVRNNLPNLYRYIALLFLLTLFVRVVLITYYNSSYGGIEQNVIYGIQRLLLGQPLYQDPAAGNYAVMQYTPLWYYVIATIAKATGISGLNVQGLYMLCRLVALILNILTVLTAALILRSWQYSRIKSLIFAMPLLVILTSHFYTRGDSMYLFLFVAAIYAYIRYSQSRILKHLIVAALFSGGCIMTKQSGILVIGIISSCLLFVDRKFSVALFYVLCTFLIVYIIAAATVHGAWHSFYRNAYLGLKNGIGVYFLFDMFIKQYYLDMVPFYVLGGIMVWIVIKKTTDRTFTILTIGAVLSFLFAVITGLKKGSSNNYFTEFLVFEIIAVPYLLQAAYGGQKFFRIFNYTITIKRFAIAAFIILITSKTSGLLSAVYIEKRFKNEVIEYAHEQALYQYMTQQLNITKGDNIFFTDRKFLDNIFAEYALMPTKDVVAQVYNANPWTYNYSTFCTGMNTGLVKYIIATNAKPDINEWHKTIPFILFDNKKFRLLTNYLGYSIYVFISANSKRAMSGEL